MIAKVKLEDKEYYSYIYFLCKYDDMTKAIVFNALDDRFEFVDAYKSKYSSEKIIYLFDYSYDNLVQKEEIKLNLYTVNECLGFDFLINNEDLIKDIENGNKIDEKYLKTARELNSMIDVYAWHEVTNLEEVNKLLDISGAFHDSYIRDLKYTFPKAYEDEKMNKLQIVFELYGNHFDIMMEFEEEIKVNYSFSNGLNYIYLSSIIFYDGFIYWVDGNDDLLPIDIKDNPHILAKKLRWKIVEKI